MNVRANRAMSTSSVTFECKEITLDGECSRQASRMCANARRTPATFIVVLPFTSVALLFAQLISPCTQWILFLDLLAENFAFAN